MVGLKKILIVGGGIAGMSCAIQLAKGGFHIDLIDLDPQWRVYGAGITITGPTLRALKELGVVEEVISAGGSYRGARSRTDSGMVIEEMTMPGLAKDIPYGGGIMRPALHDILARRIKLAGVIVRLGSTVDFLEDLGSSVNVVFSDGTEGRYDLVVGADGISSRTRRLIFPDAPEPKFTGQGAWRTLAPRPPGLDMIEIYLGNPIKAGITPVSADGVYMFTLSPEAENDNIQQEEQVARLRNILANFGGLIGDIRDRLGPESVIVYRPLKTIFMPAPWYKGRVVLIGDAVHAMTPHLASGAGCAIEDAIVLAHELQAVDNLEAALAFFMTRRFERCRDIFETSIKIGEMELAGASGETLSHIYGEANKRLVIPI